MRKFVPLALLPLVVGLAACSGAGSVSTAASPETSAECSHEDRALLNAAPILTVKPADAHQVNQYQECDGPAAYAGRHYQTGLSPTQVLAFYQEKLTGDSWRMRSLKSPPPTDPPADGYDVFCAETSIGGKPAYLELWYPDDDSGLLNGLPEGTVYALDLARESRTSNAVTPDC